MVIGRGPLTGLKDKRVGRRQLVLTAYGEEVQVFCVEFSLFNHSPKTSLVDENFMFYKFLSRPGKE